MIGENLIGAGDLTIFASYRKRGMIVLKSKGSGHLFLFFSTIFLNAIRLPIIDKSTQYPPMDIMFSFQNTIPVKCKYPDDFTTGTFPLNKM
jgi:hypothetical protein